MSELWTVNEDWDEEVEPWDVLSAKDENDTDVAVDDFEEWTEDDELEEIDEQGVPVGATGIDNGWKRVR